MTLRENKEARLPQACLTIVNPLGLHARAASKFVNLAKTFESDVRLGKGSTEADGKSIMSVMLLAAPVGSDVTLTVAGPDEDMAFAALQELVNNGFGELG
jgi:phosphocarrier protein